MTSYPVHIGDAIAGKYRVERVLGEGGMGLVVAARHLELDQIVAIKFLLPQIAEHVTAAQRFRREARAAARIRGEHACRVLDVATLDNGVPYMVMEYLEGCDLSTELVRRGRLPASEAVDYLLQASEALAEAHAGGIIHRDLKPGNFFLAMRADGSRCLKVLDFGVSKLLSDSEASPLGLTSTATMIGSPLYMSPEQLESSKGVDARTDIWGLGVVLYELVTGRTPFVADSLAQLTHQVLAANPPTCAMLGIDVPDGLEAAIRRALSKRREDRFATVAEFARALVPYGPAHGAVSAARVARMSPGAPSGAPNWGPGRNGEPLTGSGFQGSRASASGTPASWERRSSPSGARRQLGLIALVVALLGLGVLAFWLRQRPSGTAEPVARPAPLPPPSAPASAPSITPPTTAAAEKIAVPGEGAASGAPPGRTVPELPGAETPAASKAAVPGSEAIANEPAIAPAPRVAEGMPVVRPPRPAPLMPRPSALPPSPAATQAPASSSTAPRVSDFGGRR